jgi:hypothetical protein
MGVRLTVTPSHRPTSSDPLAGQDGLRTRGFDGFRLFCGRSRAEVFGPSSVNEFGEARDDSRCPRGHCHEREPGGIGSAIDPCGLRRLTTDSLRSTC